jgi:hypothetical protein
VPKLRTMAPMSRLPVHQPPPPPLVAELLRAGLSRSTVLAMESWKAREVLDLLYGAGRVEIRFEPAGSARGSI